MLTPTDQESVAAFDGRLQIVRDRTKGVAMGWNNGFYLWGAGGISKSWTVVDELHRLEEEGLASYRITNSRMTAKGLFELLEEFPFHVHVLEDMESLCVSPNAAGVLRSALWSTNPDCRQQHEERLITWRVGSYIHEFIFTGGIILIMNEPLDDLPALRAVKTRIPHLHLQPTNAELRAKMREVSLRGYRHGSGVLTPEECMEVCEYVIRKCDAAGRNYDLRMLIGGFRDRLQFQAGDSVYHWEEMVDSTMKELVILPSRALRISEEIAIAVAIDAMKVPQAEKIRLWSVRTGESKATYYRRLKGND
jgi:hypothetical protein